MFELVVAACLIKSPHVCREFAIDMPGANKLQCTLASQIELAKWAAEHDAYRITRFACVRTTAKA